MKITTKDLTIAGLLTALSVIIITFMPSVKVEPFSATLGAHTPIFIAMFLNPVSALLTVLGGTIAFYLKLGPIVALRAFSHIFFAMTGLYLYKKKMNIVSVCLITMVIHALFETGIVYASVFMGNGVDNGIWLVTGVGTMLHHIIDFVIAVLIFETLKKAKVF